MNEDLNLKSSVGVVGAGIQGVCTSIFLLKKGLLEKTDKQNFINNYIK